ncbi:MAG: hypothetical protein QF785_03455 [Phycisphaeraceae bacterium]|jgi:hypothetical protein|nr:hypothetical protein [Phycisphaeraceae bacterium]
MRVRALVAHLYGEEHRVPADGCARINHHAAFANELAQHCAFALAELTVQLK